MTTVTLDNKVIAYHAEFSKMLGSVQAGLFLSQLLYWQGKGRDPEGWIYKTQKGWYEETGLGRKAQETARKVLREAGIIKEKVAGIPAKLHFWLNIKRLNECLTEFRKSVAEGRKPTKLVCPDGTNKSAQSGQTITENTAQISFVVVKDETKIENVQNLHKPEPSPTPTAKQEQEEPVEPVSPALVEKTVEGIQEHLGVSVPEWSVRSLLSCGNWSWEYIQEKIKEVSGCEIKKSVTGLLLYALETNMKTVVPEHKRKTKRKSRKKREEVGNSYHVPASDRKKEFIKAMYMS